MLPRFKIDARTYFIGGRPANCSGADSFGSIRCAFSRAVANAGIKARLFSVCTTSSPPHKLDRHGFIQAVHRFSLVDAIDLLHQNHPPYLLK